MIGDTDLLRLGHIQDDLDSDLLWAAFDACLQGGLDEHDAFAGIDVTSLTADGWYRLDGRDVRSSGGIRRSPQFRFSSLSSTLSIYHICVTMDRQ
jgi:hypothetical protein